MRPDTLPAELPTHTEVRVKIISEFAKYLKELRTDIAAAPGDVSVLWDMWSAPHTSEPYLGLLLQWIQVDSETGKWTFRSEVGAFFNVYGSHSGINLGRYLILLLDRVGVTSKTRSKVSHSDQASVCITSH